MIRMKYYAPDEPDVEVEIDMLPAVVPGDVVTLSLTIGDPADEPVPPPPEGSLLEMTLTDPAKIDAFFAEVEAAKAEWQRLRFAGDELRAEAEL